MARVDCIIPFAPPEVYADDHRWVKGNRPSLLQSVSDRPGYGPPSDTEIGLGIMYAEYTYGQIVEWNDLRDLFDSLRRLWNPQKIFDALNRYVARASATSSDKDLHLNIKARRRAVAKIFSGRAVERKAEIAALRAQGVALETKRAREYPKDEDGQLDMGFA